MTLDIFIALLVLGAAAGLLAGLLGIGGGIILVPALYYGLNHLGYFEHAMHLAVGSSLCTIFFTTLSATRAHYKKKAIELSIVKRFIPCVLVGSVCGIYLAQYLNADHLKITFALVQLSFGSYLLLRGHQALFVKLPKAPTFHIIGSANACLATLVGVGGGVQNILFMTLCNIPIHQAIANAAAISPILASISAIGFMYIGLEQQNLPPLSLGYVNLPIVGCLTITSILAAQKGAQLAHKLPVKTLKNIFSIFTLVVALKMLFDALL